MGIGLKGGKSATMWSEVIEVVAKRQNDNTGASIDPPNIDFSWGA